MSFRTSEAARRTRIVFEAVTALVQQGRTSFRPGDVASHLRASDSPVGAWEIRGEFTVLERMSLIRLDPELAVWHLVDGATFSIEAAKEQKAGSVG